MYYEVSPTASEKILARALKKARILFRQNVFIKNWEVDFLISSKVIVEVDGWVHLQKSVIEKDRRKDKTLGEAGYIVIRVTNDDCHCNLRQCIQQIKDVMALNKKAQIQQIARQNLLSWQIQLQACFRQCQGGQINVLPGSIGPSVDSNAYSNVFQC